MKAGSWKMKSGGLKKNSHLKPETSNLKNLKPNHYDTVSLLKSDRPGTIVLQRINGSFDV